MRVPMAMSATGMRTSAHMCSQGQLLALIESPEVDQELNQARATLAQAQANLTLADITANRYQGLINTRRGLTAGRRSE